jgi:hypothetical protein
LNPQVVDEIPIPLIAAGGRAEQRTAEYRISNRSLRRAQPNRISKDGFASLSLFFNRQNTSLRHSIFMIRYSPFDKLRKVEVSFSIKLTAFQAGGGVAAFSLGAEGVQMGTRFVAVNENDSPPARLRSLKTLSTQRFFFAFDLPLRGMASQKQSALEGSLLSLVSFRL